MRTQNRSVTAFPAIAKQAILEPAGEQNPSLGHPRLPFLSPLLLLAILAAPIFPGRAQSTNDPRIVIHPIGGKAAVGESFEFNVVPGGTPPFSYQWFFKNSRIAGRTNASLQLTNVTTANSGLYFVKVTNVFGAINSFSANLAVSTSPPRTVTVIDPNSPASPALLPLELAANGQENSVSLSLLFNPAVLQNPGFLPASGNLMAAVDLSRSGEGLVGVTVSLPQGERFLRTNHVLGEFVFDAAPGSNALTGPFQITNSPTATSIKTTNGTNLVFNLAQRPSLTPLQILPSLNPQSGLFEHRVRIAHAGPATLTNLEVAVYNLGRDSNSHPITLYNAFDRDVLIDPDNDGLNLTAATIRIGQMQPATTLDLTFEYLVPNHVTSPFPRYTIFGQVFTTPVIPKGTFLSITTNRFLNGHFVIEFPTRGSTFTYYIQYADSTSSFTNNGSFKSAFPPLTGTGSSVQWSDTGPPKTDPPPATGARFYRVLQIEPP